MSNPRKNKKILRMWVTEEEAEVIQKSNEAYRLVVLLDTIRKRGDIE